MYLLFLFKSADLATKDACSYKGPAKPEEMFLNELELLAVSIRLCSDEGGALIGDFFWPDEGVFKSTSVELLRSNVGEGVT